LNFSSPNEFFNTFIDNNNQNQVALVT